MLYYARGRSLGNGQVIMTLASKFTIVERLLDWPLATFRNDLPILKTIATIWFLDNL